MLVALVAIQAAALSIYVFEWFSPVGHNMKVANFKLHTMQCSQTVWAWASLWCNHDSGVAQWPELCDIFFQKLEQSGDKFLEHDEKLILVG